MNRFYQLLAVVMLSAPFWAWSQDDAVIFTATPERCIALHKGQTCYQEVLFRWQTPASGEYCLILTDRQHQLTCWTGKAIVLKGIKRRLLVLSVMMMYNRSHKLKWS